MGSGKYGALSGLVARMQMLDNINSNLANVNTSGYKKGIVAFEGQLTRSQAGRRQPATSLVRVSEEGIDFSQGGMEKTGNPLNIAINGEGFFRILQKNGEMVYARRGSFQRNALGEMVTFSGGKLLGKGDAPVVLPIGAIDVTRDGTILSENQATGEIPLYLFDDTRVLQRGNDGVFIAPQDARTTIDPNPEMLQGYLEGSNVNVMQEMARMVANTRAFESSQKALTAYGKIGRKMAELGSIQ